MSTNDEAPRIMFNSRIRRSPYFSATRRHACKAYSTYNHMFLPSYYDDPVSEYWKLLNDVTLWDVGVERIVEITGPSHIRRMEAGILNYGNDMTLENNPYEVGLGWLVDLDQEADFIGKVALKRIKAEGVKRKLVGVEIHGDSPPAPNEQPTWPVSRDGARIGDLRSFAHSPRLEKTIGYAMVPIEHAELGTELTVETSDDEVKATVVKKPFFDPKKDIPKS